MEWNQALIQADNGQQSITEFLTWIPAWSKMFDVMVKKASSKAMILYGGGKQIMANS